MDEDSKFTFKKAQPKNTQKASVRQELPADATGVDVDDEERRLAEEERDIQLRQQKLVERKKLVEKQKALNSFKTKFEFLQKFIDEDKKSPDDRDDVSIMIMFIL